MQMCSTSNFMYAGHQNSMQMGFKKGLSDI